mgnify:CR=1 FL=1
MASIIAVNELQHSNGTTAATIDSSGRILQPAKPAFKATCASQTIAHGTFTLMDATTSVFNVGSHYSTSTKTFTAPVDGLYYFYARWFGSASTGRGASAFYVNDVKLTEHFTPMSNVNGGICYGGYDTFQLSANDTVKWCGYQESGSNVTTNANTSITHWGGYLVG